MAERRVLAFVIAGLVIGLIIGAVVGRAPVGELEEKLSEREKELAETLKKLSERDKTLSETIKKLAETEMKLAKLTGLEVPVLYKMMDLLAKKDELKVDKVYKLRAYVVGPGPMGIKKATNLELGARDLNAMLAMIGLPARVEISVEFTELKWEPAIEKFYTDFKAGVAPDIVTFRDIADLAKGGFIVSMDEHVKEFWDVHYYDFHPIIWEGATWGGKIWGIPHDLCPVGVWYRKDVLRRLGYTDAKIAEMLPVTGKTTMDTLAKLAKEAVDAKLVDFGILHRPSWGPGTYATLLAFGAEMYDPITDKPVLNKPALLKFFEWHEKMVKDKVIPAAPPTWATIHTTFVEGKTFSTWASHVGTPSEWKEKYGLTDEVLEKDLGFLPFPPAVAGVEPISVHDFPGYLVTTQSKHPEIAKLVIMFATSVEADAIHSEFTLRPPYRKSTVDHPRIKAIDYIVRTAPVAATVRPLPIYPKFGAYGAKVFEALKGVEAGVVTPARAVADLEAWFKAELPDGIIRG
ncbi:MAG: Bacterial extracellular solute-binding protein [Candidatus Bathyarchaeota archaeon BA1]|nr:MAG: Bacterial extracellular solute-binding protein [Candidatus Bathyarchaeota archaeon BA1]